MVFVRDQRGCGDQGNCGCGLTRAEKGRGMRLPLIFMFGFVAALGFVFAGAYLVRKPERVHRVVSFGQAPDQTALGRFRIIGWSYIVGGAVGALMFLGATLLILLHTQ
jgi:hypothetical protein